MNSAYNNVPPMNGSTPAVPPAIAALAKPTGIGETTLAETWLIIRKRRWVIVCAGVLGAILGVIIALTTPKLYMATSNIEIRPGSSDQYRLQGAASDSIGDDVSTRLETEVTIMQSETLLRKVAKELNLQDDQGFFGSKRPMPHRYIDDDYVWRDVYTKMHSSLSVRRLPKTEIVSISYTSLDAKVSARIVNTLVRDYVDRSYQVRFDSTKQVTGWLSGQLVDLKNKVEASQEKMVDLQKHLGILGLDQNHNLLELDLDSLTKAANDAKVARIVQEARMRVMAENTPDIVEGGMAVSAGRGNDFNGTNSLLSALRDRESTLQVEYSQLLTQYGSRWPAVVAQKARLQQNEKEIREEQRRVMSQQQAELDAAKNNEQMANAARQTKLDEAYHLGDDIVKYTIVQRDFESNRDLYQSLLRTLSEAGIQAGLQSSEVDIVDIAGIPTIPSGPRRSSVVILGAIFGMISGVALAFLLESLDTSLRSVAEIEASIELPSLAIIPRARRALRTGASGRENMPAYMRNIEVLSQPKTQFSEAFRSLRTSLLLSTVGHPPKIIVLTSSVPSEGKTTVASNISAALAQRDVRVLLIDADLRRPTVHHRFGLSSKIGLTTILTNTTTFEEALQQVPDLPNLDILSSGPVPPFPTEMIASDRMAEILKMASERYTHIVIDSPPILSVTDGVILARMADAVGLVIRHAGASKHIVRRARDLLLRAGAPVTGIILNAVDLSSPEYYGYYGYYRYAYASSETAAWEPNGHSESGRSLKDSQE